ncbi:MAG: L-threonylcarbamoyladenylate synthase [Bacteroidota bacterium]
MSPLPADPESAARIADLLRTGGTAVVPAEGVYGLVCSASRPDAIARLLQLKGRESTKPMLVLAPSWEAARPLAAEIPEALAPLVAQRRAVTVLLPARDDVPFGLSGPERLVGVRLPADRLGRALTEAGGLTVSTSANRSGEPTPRSLDEVPREILRRVDAAVDGGGLAGTPSTVARWERGRLVVMREGAVDRATLADLTGLRVE